MQSYRESERDIPIYGEYDVIIVGAGPLQVSQRRSIVAEWVFARY